LATFVALVPAGFLAFAGCESSSTITPPPAADATADARGDAKIDATADAASCTNPGTPACVASDAGALADVAVVPCILDECNIAAMAAFIAIESSAAAQGQSKATDANVKAVAARMARDFAADRTNLTALETALAIQEKPCAESEKVTAALNAHLNELAGDAGPAFDQAFVRSQTAALTELQTIINFDLIGCAANGTLKTSLRFDRWRTLEGGVIVVPDAGTGETLGVVGDLAALAALADGGGS